MSHTPHTWDTGDVITAALLNSIENDLAGAAVISDIGSPGTPTGDAIAAVVGTGGGGGGTSTPVSDATANAKGIVQLAGDLGGSAAAPQVTSGNHHSHLASQISDASTVGRSVLAGADAATIRTVIGAGTSSLALGTTNATAKAGNWTPTIADLPGGSTVTVLKSGSTWPARPTSRADIIVQWKGADPSPAIVSTGTGGMLNGVDVRFVTP